MPRIAGLALPALAAAGLLLFACGTSTSAAPAPAPADAGGDEEPTTTDEDAGAEDAGPTGPVMFTPTFPQVESRGGPVIAKPRVVPIVFTGDPLQTDITSLVEKIAASKYWTDQAAEYKVGALTAASTMVVNEAAPTTITSADIETWLKAKLTGTTPAFGAPDADTLYAIFYPSGTTITMEEGGFGQSCQGYGGYHFELDVNGTKVGYAVLPRCSDLDDLGIATSHELFEWATDPYPMTEPAFNKLDDEHWAWQPVMLGELGDMCTFMDRDPLLLPEIGVAVQRQWSNKLSKSGVFPCAPKKSVTYIQAIPHPVDDVEVPDTQLTATLKTKAVVVPPGGSKTVDILVYADKKVSSQVPMRVLGYDELYGRPNGTGFTYEFDTTSPGTTSNGDGAYADAGTLVQVTIHAPKTKAFDLALSFAYTGKDSANFWPVLVTNDKTLTGSMKGPTFGTQEPLGTIGEGVSALKASRLKKNYRVWKNGVRRPTLPALR